MSDKTPAWTEHKAPDGHKHKFYYYNKVRGFAFV
jgi:hypothetical protein